MVKKLWAIIQGWFGVGAGQLGPVYKQSSETSGPQFGELIPAQNLAGNIAPASVIADAHAAFPILLKADSIFDIEAKSYREAAAHFKSLADEMVLTMNFAAKTANGVRVYRRIGGRPMSSEEYEERTKITTERADSARGAKSRGAAAAASTLAGVAVTLSPEEITFLKEAGKEMRGKHMGAARIHPPVAIAPHDQAARSRAVAGNRNRGAKDFDIGLTDEQVLNAEFIAACNIPAAPPMPQLTETMREMDRLLDETTGITPAQHIKFEESQK